MSRMLEPVPDTALFVEPLQSWMMDAFVALLGVAVAESDRSSDSDDDPAVLVTPGVIAAAGPRRSLAELRALVMVAAAEGWVGPA